MTTYYVGSGGSNANNGLTWDTRKLTLNGAEDIPVAAGDTVYVGPGVYRELLTVDISGTPGNPITYIGDITGEHTDSAGGIVRVTGSDNDQTETRANCISGSDKDYRTFQGFMFDTTSTHLISSSVGCTSWTIQDSIFYPGGGRAIYVDGATQNSWTIRRCLFLGALNNTATITFNHSSVVDNANHLIENCIFLPMTCRGIHSIRVGGITIKNSTFLGAGGASAVRIEFALTVGQTINVNNCIFLSCNTVFTGTVVGEIVEDYNLLYRNGTNYQNTNTGVNTVTYPPLFMPPTLLSGIKFPWQFGALSPYSQVREFSGINVPTDDLFGLLRPTLGLYGWVDASLGAIQYQDITRATNTVRTGISSLLMADSARHQIFVPIVEESTTFSVYVYREASYIGNNPQMIIKQPGQSNRFAIDVGPAGQWNNLSITFTPAALPPYVVIELVSENQQENSLYGGNHDVYWDDLTVT